jgi:hypothetical protein
VNELISDGQRMQVNCGVCGRFTTATWDGFAYEIDGDVCDACWAAGQVNRDGTDMRGSTMKDVG